jgi:hypothetical protein
MCGTDEHHLYPLRNFTYCTEQARIDKVQRMITYTVYTGMVHCTCISVSSLVGIHIRLPED